MDFTITNSRIVIGGLVVAMLLAPTTSADEPDAAESTVAEPIREAPITAYERGHWSFRPLERPAVPNAGRSAWSANPIDRFIQARQEARQLEPMPEADRITLVRRLSFDLCGLPPTPDEVDRFVADTEPDAYERLVDRLLASPRYGERWAQHWLDLARFAETDGFEHDKVRKFAWRYRDWVIEAWNGDLPYDRFVAWQVAGDQLRPGDSGAETATAFCLSGPDMPDINSQEERRHNLLNELTSTVGAALLGLQIGCAQCHDHKYDPISQADFYRLRAVFEPAVHVKKNVSIDVLARSSESPPPSRLMIRGDWRRPGPLVEPAFPRIADPADDAPPRDAADETATEPQGASPRVAFADWLTRPDHPLTARVIANRIWQHHFGEGLSRSPSDFGFVGEEPSHPELLDWLAVELIESDWSIKHLHRRIVTSATYRQASRPVAEVDAADNDAARDGSSDAGSSDAGSTAAARYRRSLERDVANYWLSRFPRRRLSGEAIRDAMYAVSDSLDLRQGGPGVRPPLPDELVQTLLKNQWDVSPREADHYRRSVYVFARRNLRYPIFEAFDRPAANASCARRNRSTTAPQSLLLLNSALSLDAAQRLAECAARRTTDPDERIELIFRRVFARQPTPDERRAIGDFVARQTDLLEASASTQADGASAWTDLCLALLNASEFVYID